MSKQNRSGLGTGHRPEGDKYYFGTPEEIANRPGNGENFPEENAPHFVQTPTANTSKDINAPQLESKSGGFKFSGGI